MTGTNPEESMLRVVGAVYPDGSGQVRNFDLSIGDGQPPAILIRVGMDKKGVTVVDIAAGGFADVGSTHASLKELAAFLSVVIDGLNQVPAWEGPIGVN